MTAAPSGTLGVRGTAEGRGFLPSLSLVPDVLDGKPRAIARLISRAEAGDAECREALTEIYRHGGRAHIVGITGVPGAGKSTLIKGLAQAIRASGRKVGIVALDPSSPFSGGAILGDRVRMTELIGDAGVFLRSMATRGALGGLARASFDAVDVLDAAGFEVVLIETVGVGQDEVDIVRAAHSVVVASAPGLGDDIQAIKAGILEIADIHAVTKGDRADANRALQHLRNMLSLALGLETPANWRVPLIRTSAEEGSGIAELLAAIDDHRRHLAEQGRLEARVRRIAELRILKISDDLLRARYAARRDGALGDLVEGVATRARDPHSAAADLLRQIGRD
jgi:LAO/AO transport system kinase